MKSLMSIVSIIIITLYIPCHAYEFTIKNCTKEQVEVGIKGRNEEGDNYCDSCTHKIDAGKSAKCALKKREETGGLGITIGHGGCCIDSLSINSLIHKPTGSPYACSDTAVSIYKDSKGFHWSYGSKC